MANETKEIWTEGKNPENVGIYVVKWSKETNKNQFAVWNGKLWELPGEEWWLRMPSVYQWAPYDSEESPSVFREKSLRTIQYEIAEWSLRNFKDQKSKQTGQVLGSLAPLLGINEESGELNHVMLKRHQGIRGFDDDTKFKTERDDCIADLLVYLCDFSNREEVDLQGVLNKVWSKVQKRDWEKNKKDADVIADQLAVNTEAPGKGTAD